MIRNREGWRLSPVWVLPVLAVELSLVSTSGGSEPPVTPGPVLHTQHEHTHASPPIKKRKKETKTKENLFFFTFILFTKEKQQTYMNSTVMKYYIIEDSGGTEHF